MFRDLARMTAQLKGLRYEGALIGRAIWERRSGDTEGVPRVLRDQHGVMELMAADASGRLTLVMMLGHAAPVPPQPAERGQEPAAVRQLRLSVVGDVPAKVLRLRFSAEDVHAFVRAVGDTNPLYAGMRPLVPGLAILEAALLHPALAGATRAELRFHGASFAGDEIELTVRTAGPRRQA